ncbi:NADH-ubiquinone oxidoreductase-related-like protein [Heracleum sosnowskyi]|uniref:NADH-ubiquinone oxidoreductase-related-like protein n=1 Tax=Heracleum sosnowskyi TaxID=360622 RepID=A0AAD8N1J4_9APIA|nr:NADH-ubiquinone oxidoreductase-related-like protein [Heracleum sosnowskyi]
MMHTLNSSKTAQILARYRPIAPKPPDHDENNSNSSPNSDSSCMPQKIRDSPYLRSVWPHLQARPTRTRKRGRTSIGPAIPYKRSKPTYTPPSFLPSPSTVKNLDLNKQVPIEQDLIQQLQSQEIPNQIPHQIPNQVPNQAPCLFTPRPNKLVSSSITVQPQSTTILNPTVMMHGPTKAEEIEKGLESETLPIVISDSNNKVRLANSAYMKLVGQPECSWLDSFPTCNRICGDVKLRIPESVGNELVGSSKVVFCSVVIEWGNSEYKSSITTSGEAVRLVCESRDYVFAWRFHTQGAVIPASNF